MNLLGNTSGSNTVPKFKTENWVEVKDESGGIYNTNKQIVYL